jgi:hypothetical protein
MKGTGRLERSVVVGRVEPTGRTDQHRCPGVGAPGRSSHPESPNPPGKRKAPAAPVMATPYLARVLGKAAVAASHTNTFLGERDRRIARRLTTRHHQVEPGSAALPPHHPPQRRGASPAHSPSIFGPLQGDRVAGADGALGQHLQI